MESTIVKFKDTLEKSLPSLVQINLVLCGIYNYCWELYAFKSVP